MATAGVLCVIPARYASTRLAAKPLVEIDGLPLVMWVYRTAVNSGAFTAVVVATDDIRIEKTVTSFGGVAVMTSDRHERGTDRVWEVVQGREERFVVNLQGDEPGIPAQLLRAFCESLQTRVDDNSLLTCISTVARSEIENPNMVKVVLNRRDEALYFSRSPVPYDHGTHEHCVKHTGIYGFTREGLRRFCAFEPGFLERAEKLEQLRALENGMAIHCLRHSHESAGIDTPQDLESFRNRVAQGLAVKPLATVAGSASE